MYDLNFLKEVLSVPTKTYKEERMIQYIVDWCVNNKIPYVVDEHGNVYVTKQESEIDSDFYFPCVVSHTDTVHNIDTINVVEEYQLNAQKEERLSLKAYNDDGEPTGIGGDDKAGIFACLTLLKELPYLKAAFFVSEETGCHGSKRADKNFFSNVGYAIQFDSPENWMISEYCMGLPLFERSDKFFEVCGKVLSEHIEDPVYMKHPYTDVFTLKSLFDFSCINIPIGYYRYHTKHEYVVIEDVYNGVNIGKSMIELLGNNKYHLKPKPTKFFL
jgi:tripeptide aminopeptidase